jgi:hypothetical protein
VFVESTFLTKSWVIDLALGEGSNLAGLLFVTGHTTQREDVSLLHGWQQGRAREESSRPCNECWSVKAASSQAYQAEETASIVRTKSGTRLGRDKMVAYAEVLAWQPGVVLYDGCRLQVDGLPCSKNLEQAQDSL